MALFRLSCSTVAGANDFEIQLLVTGRVPHSVSFSQPERPLWRLRAAANEANFTSTAHGKDREYLWLMDGFDEAKLIVGEEQSVTLRSLQKPQKGDWLYLSLSPTRRLVLSPSPHDFRACLLDPSPSFTLACDEGEIPRVGARVKARAPAHQIPQWALRSFRHQGYMHLRGVVPGPRIRNCLRLLSKSKHKRTNDDCQGIPGLQFHQR